VFFIPGFKSTVFLFSERPPPLRSCLFEERGAIGKRGANLGREVGSGIRVVLFVRVRKVGAEAAMRRYVREIHEKNGNGFANEISNVTM
jgi:hypothetical protein